MCEDAFKRFRRVQSRYPQKSRDCFIVMAKAGKSVEVLTDLAPDGLLKEDAINWEVTKKLRQDPKYAAFLKWAKDNGAVFPRVPSRLSARSTTQWPSVPTA